MYEEILPFLVVGNELTNGMGDQAWALLSIYMVGGHSQFKRKLVITCNGEVP